MTASHAAPFLSAQNSGPPVNVQIKLPLVCRDGKPFYPRNGLATLSESERKSDVFVAFRSNGYRTQLKATLLSVAFTW